MMKLALIIMLVIGLGGCVTMTDPVVPAYGMEQKNKFSTALELLRQGNRAGAAELLAAICKEPEVPGVTDEALFRLSILRLGQAGDSSGVAQSKNDLERLKKEFPSSSWAPLASTLGDLLAKTNNKAQREKKLKELNSTLSKENRDLKERNLTLSREQRLLKESNLSLSKENAELRQSVEKMKSLDLDLESRPKR